jgi:hypothetical protein
MISNDPQVETLFRLKQHRPFSLTLTCEKQDKSRLDLTGASLRMVFADIKRKGGTVRVTSTATLVSAVDGTARFDVQGDDLGFTPGTYDLVITLTSAEGFASSIIEGQVELAYNPDPAVPLDHAGVVPPLSLTATFRDQNRITVRVNHHPDSVLLDALAQAQAAASAAGIAADAAAAAGDSADAAAAAAAAQVAAAAAQASAAEAAAAAAGLSSAALDQAVIDAQAFADAAAASAALATAKATAASTSAADANASSQDAAGSAAAAQIHAVAAQASADAADASADAAAASAASVNPLANRVTASTGGPPVESGEVAGDLHIVTAGQVVTVSQANGVDDWGDVLSWFTVPVAGQAVGKVLRANSAGAGDYGWTDEVVQSTTIDNIVTLTQAAYDALDPKVATTLYVIVG